MTDLILRTFHIERKLRTYSNQYILNITISDIIVGFIMAIRNNDISSGKVVDITVLNVLILIAFNIEKKLRTYPNQYILNITISDLLVGFIMAIRSIVYLYDEWIFGQILLNVFIDGNTSQTNFNISVIQEENASVIIVLQENATKPSTSIQSDLITVDIVEDGGKLGRSSTSPEQSRQHIQNQVIPMRNSTQSTTPDGIQRNPRHLSSADNHKALRTLTFIIVVFFITSLPGCISIITSNKKTLAVVGRWMTFINSLLNPVTYAMAQPVFRKTLLRIVRCRR
eukprot:XP_003730055.1 PREDICTED: muscarinic acetylcholine receptor M2-like [Strongylocentrotus purpuratus]